MRSLCLIVTLLLFSSWVVLSQSVPQLHDVTGVAADDRLNIRASPSPHAERIGALPPDARGIEVVAVDETGRWGKINSGERSGWVNLRYLAPRGVHIDNYNLPVGLSCYGTEPFWSLTRSNGGFDLEMLGDTLQTFQIEIAQDSGIDGDLRRMIHLQTQDMPATAFLYPASCSDGMSDRSFGLAISLMISLSGPLISGCCSLAH